ncbi:MAG: helix-turn-helix domain-containing protein [Candidatus Schekmanbacteria bacterium]|nr:helix-turn-helix domain-containing protein [Candidatus Schekmanbacteria bacterium]
MIHRRFDVDAAASRSVRERPRQSAWRHDSCYFAAVSATDDLQHLLAQLRRLELELSTTLQMLRDLGVCGDGAGPRRLWILWTAAGRGATVTESDLGEAIDGAGPLDLVVVRGEVRAGAEQVRLGLQEARLFVALARGGERRRADLEAELWGDRPVSRSRVSVLVGRVNRRLLEAGFPRAILAVGAPGEACRYRLRKSLSWLVAEPAPGGLSAR